MTQINRDGLGSGSGDGYGFDYGNASGLGNGLGCGDASGLGNGLGCGDGSGGGYGSGLGPGFGDGDASGSGGSSGKIIGSVGEYEVVELFPWPYVRVGCRSHSVGHWTKHWREIAETEHVEVSEAEVARLLEKCGSSI